MLTRTGTAELHNPLNLIDRYLLRQLIGWYVAIIGVIVFLLSLETIPGLLDQLSKVNESIRLVARSLASLVPEYVAVAIPISLFLSTAISFRRLAMAGELDVFAASGIGNWRMLRVPLALGLTSCVLVVGLRGYLQPAGERQLDSIGRTVESGEFGFALEAGVSHLVAPGARLYFARAESRSGRLENVLFESGKLTIAAGSATLRWNSQDRLVLSLRNGDLIWRSDGGIPHVLRFGRFRLTIPAPVPAPRRLSPPRDRLDRFDFAQLAAHASLDSDAAGLTAAMARASASARIADALLCCLLPLYGFVHGVPPKRSRSAIGIGVGLIEIIIFWRVSALIEDSLTTIAPIAHAGLVVAFALAGLQLAHFQQREGFGAVEQGLGRILQFMRQVLPARIFALFSARVYPEEARQPRAQIDAPRIAQVAVPERGRSM